MKSTLYLASTAALMSALSIGPVIAQNDTVPTQSDSLQSDTTSVAVLRITAESQMRGLQNLARTLDRTANGSVVGIDIDAMDLAELIKKTPDLIGARQRDLASGKRFARTHLRHDYREHADRLREASRNVEDLIRVMDENDRTRPQLQSLVKTGQKQIVDLHARVTNLGDGYDPLPQGLVPVPLGNSSAASCFWGAEENQLLPSFSLTGDGETGALGVDLWTDYLWGTRVTLGTGISAADDAEDTRVNAQRFLSSGGNLAFTFAWPLFSARTQKVNCTGKPAPLEGNSAQITVVAVPRISGDAPVAGTQTDDFTGNVDLGIEIDASTMSLARTFRFFGHVRSAFAWGTPQFREAIGRPSESGIFFYSQLTGGVRVADMFQISYSFPLEAPRELRDDLKGAFSISVTRSVSAQQ
jgi:hypothetical protein